MITKPFAECRQAFYFYLKDRWVACDLVVENQQYDPSSGADHIRLYTLFGEAQSEIIGPNRPTRHVGQIEIQIFTALGEGPAQIDYLTDLAMEVFSKQIINTIHCQDSYPELIGENGGWYQCNVITPFYFDSV